MSEHNIHGDTDDHMPEWARTMHLKLDKIDNHLTGGSEPSSGLIVRVDRLEQSELRKQWWASTTMGAAIAALGASLWSLLSRRP